MNSQQRYSALATIGLVYAAAIWGSTFVVVKESLDYIHPVILVGYRFSIAAGVLGLGLLLKRRPLFRNLGPGLTLGVILCVLYVFQTIGLKYTTATNSAFITGLFVAVLPILGYVLFHQVPGLPKLAAVGLSVLGLWFLTGGLHGINLGDLLTLVTAVACAAHLLYADHFVKKGHDPYMMSFQQFLTVGVLSLAMGLVIGLPFATANVATIWVVVFLALFPTLSAFLIQLLAQRHVSAIRVSLIFALEPVFAAIFSWTVGGEPFVFRRAIGGLLIFAAMLLSTPKPVLVDVAEEAESPTQP
jgi:drug/metabolite transporter (DMT)-like permease